MIKRPTMASITPATLLLLLLLLACTTARISAQQPLSGAPAALSKDEQCLDGSCADDAIADDDDDDDSSDDETYDDEEDFEDYNYYKKEDEKEAEESNDDFTYLPNDALADKTFDWSLPVLEAYIQQYVKPVVISSDNYEELYDQYIEPLNQKNKHMERIYVVKTFPDAYETTMTRRGNYTDGTKAGTPQWVGDQGAQNATAPVYASMGSVLDVTNAAGATNADSILPWLASLIHRRALAEAYERPDEHDQKPCRLDMLDDYDTDDEFACLTGVTADKYVSVRSSERLRRRDMIHAARLGIADKGRFEVGSNVLEHLKNMPEEEKFDTIFADGVLAAIDDYDMPDGVDSISMSDMDLVIEMLGSFLKPGGTLYIVGQGPYQMDEYVTGTAGEVYHEALNLLDAVKSISGTHPMKDLPPHWVHRTVNRLGLNMVSSTLFHTEQTYHDMASTIEEIKEWVDELPEGHTLSKGASFYQTLLELHDRIEIAVGDGSVYSGANDYIIVAELPLDSSKPHAFLKVDEPTEYEPSTKYIRGKKPDVEELYLPKLAPGELQPHRWANGDPYDGTSARIGIHDRLAPIITEYVKKLGIWDLMIDTINNNPMPADTTRFYTVKSPYVEGREFTWSAKRPDNFYGSDSDMHWFDPADEFAYEESLRALADGGFDDVLHAIGTHLGMDNLASFAIGLLAVTKADKGYTHVDFTNSKKRAFNFLVNLETPSNEPELTVVEEDDLGNRRRAQIKYAPDFGVLNGDDAMHATNECNHRAPDDAPDGVRITASIFIAELVEDSLKQVAEHDKYYFPFGNFEWIWAQRGRHWNKEGTVSMVKDKGRKPFTPKDAMEGCEEAIGENGEKCLENGNPRTLCYETCKHFMKDEEFRPGVDREEVFGW